MVSITAVDPPTVTSIGSVALPSVLSSATSRAASNAPIYLRRKVQVTTRRDGAFAFKAMVAKGQIDFNGNNIATDSFD